MRGTTLASCVCAVVVVVAGNGCGRENFLLTGIARDEGGRVRTTGLEYDAQGRVTRVEKGDLDEVFDEILELTWAEDGTLASILRTQLFGDFDFLTTTSLAYDNGLLVSAASTARISEDEPERDPRQEATFTFVYDKARLVESFERTLAEDNGDNETDVLTFTHDDNGLVEVKQQFAREIVGESDIEFLRVTTVSYEEGRPAALSVALDDERPVEMSVAYKGNTLEELGLAIPDNDEFGNEITRSGRLSYEYDAEERVDTLRIEADGREDIELTFEYADGSASAIDTAPSELAPVPLWDMRGTPFKYLDARTQAARFVGADW